MPSYDVSLRDFLKHATKQETQDFFPLSERMEMTRRICDGLMYINKQNVAHRDLKLGIVFEKFNQLILSFIPSWLYIDFFIWKPNEVILCSMFTKKKWKWNGKVDASIQKALW